MIFNPWRRVEPLDRTELAQLLPAPGDPVLSEERQRLLEDFLMSNATQGAHRLPRRLTLRMAVPAAAEAAEAGGETGRGAGVGGGGVTLGAGAVWASAGRRVVVAALTAAVVTAGVLIAAHYTAEPRTQSVARVLEAAATHAEEAPAVASPRARQWVYVLNKSCWNGCSEDPMWTRYDGSAMALLVTSESSRDDVLVWPSESSPRAFAVPRIGSNPAKDVTTLAALPTDPAALLRRLTTDSFYAPDIGTGAVDGRARTEFLTIANIFQNAALIPPQVEANLYRALALVPHTSVVEKPMKDAFGRSGVAVRFGGSEDPGKNDYIVLSPSYTFLGWQVALSGSDHGVRSFARTPALFVDHAGQKPGGPAPAPSSVRTVPPPHPAVSPPPPSGARGRQEGPRPDAGATAEGDRARGLVTLSPRRS